MFLNLKDIHTSDVYDGTFLLRKFSYPIFKNSLRRTGNIISFVSPIDFNSELQINYKFPSILNFCAEIPDISSYAGICFFKLFLINIADFFSKKMGKNIQIENNDLIIEDEFNAGFIILNNGLLNISQWNRMDNTFMFYIGIFNELNANSHTIVKNAYPLSLGIDESKDTCNKIESIFYNLSHNIYIESSK